MAKPKRTAKAQRGGFVVGRITMTRRGYGFVSAPEGDYFIAGTRHRRRDARRHGQQSALTRSAAEKAARAS